VSGEGALTRPPRIFIVAAEPSGDQLGADLIAALRRRAPGVELAGVGGPAMAEQGVRSLYDITELSVLGLFDGLRIFNLVKRRAAETAEAAKTFRADAAVLIDSWGFMLRAAWAIREADPSIRLIKYVGPQVFATRPGRAKALAAAVDRLLGIHPFDPDFFEPEGLPTTFVGNPALDRDLSGDGAAWRAARGVAPDARLGLVLFGSRKSELTRLYEPFAQAAAAVLQTRPDLRLVTVLSPAIAEDARARIAADPRLSGLIVEDAAAKRDVFDAVDAALACSGTVTLELARVGVPTIAAYRLGWFAWAVARAFLMRSRFISLANIAADEALIPEFVQTRCTGAKLGAAFGGLLDDAPRRAVLSERLRETTRIMAGEARSPSDAAATAVLDEIAPGLR